MKKYIYIALMSTLLTVACGGNPKSQVTHKDNMETVEQENTDSIRVSPSPNKQYSRTTTKEKMDSGNFFYFIVLLLAILGEGYLIYQLWKDNKKLKNKLDRISDNLKPKIGRVEYSNSDIEVIKLLNEIKSELRNDIPISNSREKVIENSDNPTASEHKRTENKAEPKSTECFLKIKGRSSFKETENRDEADCFVYTDNGIFLFFTDKEHTSRLKAKKDIYKDVVDCEGDETIATGITIVKPGRCVFSKEDNMWIVKEKAKIKFV